MNQTNGTKVAITGALLLMAAPFPSVVHAQAAPPVNIDATATDAMSVDEKNERQRRTEGYLQEVRNWVQRMESHGARIEPAIVERLNAAESQLERLKYAPGEKWEAEIREVDAKTHQLKLQYYAALAKSRSERVEAERQARGKLNDWRTELRDVKAHAANASAIVKKDVQADVARLEREYQTASAKMKQLESVASDEWAHAKSDLDDQIDQGRSEVQTTAAKLREKTPEKKPY